MSDTFDVWFIVGLPGSGKTHLAYDSAKAQGGIVVDDIKDVRELPSTLDQRWIITDPNFCKPGTLERAKKMVMDHVATIDKQVGVMIFVQYFENNPEQCRKNVRHRNDGREVEGTIRKYEKIYNPPYWARKVWECPE